VFGFSFGELLVISLVTLVAVGPQKLPGVLKTMGQWARKLRKMTLDVRQQTGIDEMLRAEGIQLSELRSLMRGYHPPSPAPSPSPVPAPPPSPVSAAVSLSTSVSSAVRNDDPYLGLEPDPTREYPPEGADAYGALPDDLLEPPRTNEIGAAPGDPAPEPEPPPAGAEPPAASPLAAAPPVVASVPPVVAAAPPVVAAAPPVVAAAPPVVAAAPPVVAAAPPVVAAAPRVEAASAVNAQPPSVRPRSLPPPPPSRPAAPRPSSGPPPPPRRTAPPRPEPNNPVSKPEAPAGAVVPPTRGSVNGNG